MSRAGKTKTKRGIFASVWLGFGDRQAGCSQGGTGGAMGTSNILSQPARRGNAPPQQPFDPAGKWKEQSWNISSSSSSSLGAKGRGILEQRCLQDSWGVQKVSPGPQTLEKSLLQSGRLQILGVRRPGAQSHPGEMLSKPKPGCPSSPGSAQHKLQAQLPSTGQVRA